ncbi:hypothetical protein [Neobacillus niacini]|uniref:hypothetical protein n=1 Tax=Neobacillus niacini TaxID=86668 RepID=UPI00285448BE|nr:hypothetical protein [Neobacillus niacini]MDR7002381.1 hypothetical protein [Neobacillus niacini]
MPSITRVIEVHQEIESVSNAPMLIISEILWIFFGIVFIVHLLKDKKSFSLLGLTFRGFSFVITLLIIRYLTISIKNCNFSINENQWKKGYLNPYILSLPEHKLLCFNRMPRILRKDRKVSGIRKNAVTLGTKVMFTIVLKFG